MDVLKVTTIKRLIERYSEMRVSHKSAKLLRAETERWVSRVVKSAEKFAKHGKRKTIKEEDILLALETM